MQTFKLDVTRHHNCDADGFSDLIDAATEEDAWVEAFRCTVAEIGGFDESDVPAEAVRQALATAKASGEASLVFPDPCGEEDDEPCRYALWWQSDVPAPFQSLREKTNVGIGASDDGTIEKTDKHENRWLTLTPWTPQREQYDALMAWTKEALALEVLRLRAVS